MGAPCSKLAGKKSYHPVCSVRTNGEAFVVCQDRVIPAKARSLTSFHITALAGVSHFLFPGVDVSDIGYRRQVSLRLGSGNQNRVVLDYVLRIRDNASFPADGPRQVILEVQGGGETSNTGTITRHVETWAASTPRTNSLLRQSLPRVGTIPNNAWKRQLEQILRKVALTEHFGGAVALAMGKILFDYVRGSVAAGGAFRPDWKIALLCIDEEPSKQPGPIPLDMISESVFMTYEDFIEAIRNYPLPANIVSPFGGRYRTLTNTEFDVPL